MKKPDKKPQEIEIEIRATGIPMVGGDTINEIVSLPKNTQIIPFDEGWFMPGTIGQGLAKELLEYDQAAANRKVMEQQRALTYADLVEAQRKIDAAFGRTLVIDLTGYTADAERAFAKVRDALIKFGRDLEQERADRIFPWAAAALLLALAILTAILVVPHVP